MDPNFKSFKTGMVTVKERYPCGKGTNGSKGRLKVYYLCRCDCGKEFIVSGDELSKHPYSCGCTPKPKSSIEKGPRNRYALGLGTNTSKCMLKPTRAVYSSSSTGVSGVYYDHRRRKWEARIVFQGKRYFLGSYTSKLGAIMARIAGEKKYFDSWLNKEEK